MVQTGNELIAQTEQLESGMQKGVKEPVTNIVKELTVLQKELDGLNTQLTNLKTTCESKVTELNTAIDDYNNKVAAAKNAANTSSEKISQSIQALETQKSKASSDAEKQQLQQSIDTLKNAKTAADGLKNVNTVEKASISIDNIDTSDITKGIITLTGNLQTASKTMEGLGSQLGEMQTKLDTITAAKDKIPADQLNSLTSKLITKLNAGPDASGTAEENADYSFNLYDRQGNIIYPAGVMHYNGAESIVSLHNYPMSDKEKYNYYEFKSGDIRTRYADTADGLCKSAVNNMAAYADDISCAELIFEGKPRFTSLIRWIQRR